MGFMKRTTPAEKGIPLTDAKRTTSDLTSSDSAVAYEADAAELEAAVAGTMAAGADADAVFGEISEGGPNYRAVGWKCEYPVRPRERRVLMERCSDGGIVVQDADWVGCVECAECVGDVGNCAWYVPVVVPSSAAHRFSRNHLLARSWCHYDMGRYVQRPPPLDWC